MPSAEIPYIKDLPSSVEAAVGENVQVYIHDNDPTMGPVRRLSHEMVSDVVSEMFTREGVRPTKDLEILCILAARIAIAKLASSPGFTIELGGTWYEQNPRETIEVTLRPDEIQSRKAKVKSNSKKKGAH